MSMNNLAEVQPATKTLRVSVGQCSDKGCKEINQDFHAIQIPQEPLLSSKGIAIALADGISSSSVSQIASESAVNSFLSDYYCTSEAWSVKTSAQRVLTATNSWLHAQTRQSQFHYDLNKGYVCTFTGMVLKSRTAHVFHAGDCRLYKVHANALEQVTSDHRLYISEDQSYLSRALGIHPQLELDYHSLSLEEGDTFLLATDGIYEFVDNAFVISTLKEHSDDLDLAAQKILQQALANNSDDNLTLQIVRIDELADEQTHQLYQQMSDLPFPPMLEARDEFDGYKIQRKLHASSRSHVYLAVDMASGEQVVIKTPSIDLRDDKSYLERFLMEEWIARRIDNAHVLKPCKVTRKRNFLYITTEFIEGQTLSQWMIDNPKPSLESVRDIVEQITKGLRAFHRLEMIHQDLRPANIMIDTSGTVKIIDFGSTRVAGLKEIRSPLDDEHILGTLQYTAPEYFLGEPGSPWSDMFSLGVITYQMLCGELPYGLKVCNARTKVAQRNLAYRSVLDDDREIPAWVDDALKKVLHVDPYKRYEDLSEFIYELRHPSQKFLSKTRPPLMERNPVLFWQSIAVLQLLVIIYFLAEKFQA